MTRDATAGVAVTRRPRADHGERPVTKGDRRQGPAGPGWPPSERSLADSGAPQQYHRIAACRFLLLSFSGRMPACSGCAVSVHKHPLAQSHGADVATDDPPPESVIIVCSYPHFPGGNYTRSRYQRDGRVYGRARAQRDWIAALAISQRGWLTPPDSEPSLSCGLWAHDHGRRLPGCYQR